MEEKQYNEIDILRTEYEDVCNRYLHHFCENYGLACEPSINDAWIGEKHGDFAMVDDLIFDFTTIKYAVEMRLTDVDELLEWYDYCTGSSLYGYESPTFKAWHSGCPRLSDKQIAELRKMRENIHEHNGMSYD